MWRKVVPYVGIALAVMIGTALAPHAWETLGCLVVVAAVGYLVWMVKRLLVWLDRRFAPPWGTRSVIIEDPSTSR